MPERIQRKRTRGWKMPPNTVSVTRPGTWGNPFRVGGWFKIGDGRSGFIWLQAADLYADATFTRITTPDQAVEFYRTFLARYPRRDIHQLRGKNLACFCPLDQPCHADVLLVIANAPQRFSDVGTPPEGAA